MVNGYYESHVCNALDFIGKTQFEKVYSISLGKVTTYFIAGEEVFVACLETVIKPRLTKPFLVTRLTKGGCCNPLPRFSKPNLL